MSPRLILAQHAMEKPGQPAHDQDTLLQNEAQIYMQQQINECI